MRGDVGETMTGENGWVGVGTRVMRCGRGLLKRFGERVRLRGAGAAVAVVAAEVLVVVVV